MANGKKNVLSRARVYIDGTNEFIGVAEVELPEITTKNVDHETLGAFGKDELPVGLDVMSMKFTFKSLYKDQLGIGYNPFINHKLQIRANVKEFGPAGVESDQAFIIMATGRFKKAGGGGIKPKENLERDAEFTVVRYSETYGGAPRVEIDIDNNIWRVNGTDILEQERINIGG